MTNNTKGLTKSQALKLLNIIDVKILISNKQDNWEDALYESVHEDLLIKDLLDLCEDDCDYETNLAEDNEKQTT